MRAFGFLIVTMMLALFGFAVPAEADTPLGPGPHLAIRLVPETAEPKPGSTLSIALDTRPQPGWHGYWSNPGDAGFAAKLDWTLPKGASVSDPVYPAPERLTVAGLMNYVYERPYAPIVRLKVPMAFAPGTALPIRLHMDYLVCTTTLCVPESADLSLDLKVGDGTIQPDIGARFDVWRRALPQPLGVPATYQADGRALRIAIPYPADAAGKGAYLYPTAAGIVDYAEPQAVSRDGDRLLITTKPGAAPKGTLDGVLAVDGRALSVTARPGVVPVSGPVGGAQGWQAALIAFLGAVLGGLILNVMPCVFPILSLKALSLARAGGEERGARHEALAYTAGAVLVCLALGGVVLALRAGGDAAGWAFQLQNPRTVLLLLLLTVGIALNLAGAFELPLPAFAQRSGHAGGAFATGALAAFVATPCAGPFMGVALGVALVLPWPVALAVFGGLGLGLALPFLLLGFVPALRRALPRPGAWMDRVRRILSIPMWLTAVALVWVLGREIGGEPHAGVDAIGYALLASLGFAIVLWAAGRRQARGLGFGLPAIAMLAAIAVAGTWLIRPQPHRASVAAAGEEPFSEARLSALRAQGRPVFAYFTADWCLTCKVNERVAIDTDGVRRAFADRKVAVLVGDWTNGDPALGRFIEAHNRAGVPLYLYYAPGAAQPQVLPQVLTPAMLEAL